MSGREGRGRLAGHAALVTGSTRGLGRTIAEWLAREGARVVVSGREEAAVRVATDELRALGGDALGIAADLARPDEAHRLATAALAALGRLDLLVNNAGMSIRAPFWEVGDADWDYQLNVNLRAPFILAQHAARRMIERGTGGRIVNVSSVLARAPQPDCAPYSAAKGGIESLTRNLAYELAPHGITVNCVAPGAIDERPGVTPDPAGAARAAGDIPIGRVGRAEDIAAAVLFFCLPESAFTTGQTLLIDGAHHGYLPGERHRAWAARQAAGGERG